MITKERKIWFYTVLILCITTNIYSNDNVLLLDSFIIERNGNRVRYMSKTFFKEREILQQQNHPNGLENDDGYFDLSKESRLKIEADDGIAKILESCLSKENYKIFSDEIRAIYVETIANQDGYVCGIAFSFFIGRSKKKDFTLDKEETACIFSYINELQFDYKKGGIPGEYLIWRVLPVRMKKH